MLFRQIGSIERYIVNIIEFDYTCEEKSYYKSTGETNNFNVCTILQRKFNQ